MRRRDPVGENDRVSLHLGAIENAAAALVDRETAVLRLAP